MIMSCDAGKKQFKIGHLIHKLRKSNLKDKGRVSYRYMRKVNNLNDVFPQSLKSRLTLHIFCQCPGFSSLLNGACFAVEI